ncbi:class I SAM-dependent methyltransferase [Carboxylicivirga linearis]|uniref:Class I SAM-dependent methyltransferase n=1 Tax=Carboxylicivirga linearis TaxID=1628157 RepID=A0ABS5JV12_9BACT|nr:class I SAM-dependent methyltransferase [Carboxylicivirga linearis]MBS2098311.1 class I SAM-dependent methyltransferase [Carboxylicivirga linearis]
MQYDPIKRSLGKIFNQTPALRILFYRLLDLLLLRSWYIRRELKIKASQSAEQLNVLDAGSGFGQYDYFMSTLGKKWNITGVDVKKEQIEDCNQFFKKIGRGNRVKFEIGDLTKFVKPDTYDLILSVDVMEHILEDELVFENFFKSMKKDGTLLISTPSDQGGSDTHHDHEEDGVHGFIDEHVRDGYNANDIREKLERAGFSQIETHYTYGKPGSLSWKLSMKFPILMLNASKVFFILLPFYYILTYPLAFILNMIDTASEHKKGTGLMVVAHKK